MDISNLLTDAAILAELGDRIARRRIDLQLTQADLASQAGVSKRTVERVESGASAQMSSIIRIFRVLGLLQNFEHILPQTGPGPMELLRGKGKTRQRATRSRKPDDTGRPWTWDETT